MKRFERPLKYILALLLTLSMTVPVLADTLSDAQTKKSEIESELEASKQRLEELQASKESEETKLNEIQTELDSINAIIADYESQAAVKQSEIDDLQADIDARQADIDEAYDYMKLRIKYMYENMSDVYVEALLSGESFGGILEQLQYLLDLNSYDRSMMDKLEVMQQDLADSQESIQVELDELQELQDAQEAQKAVTEELYAEQSEILSNINFEVVSEEDEQAALEAELEEQKDIIASYASSYDSGSTGGGYVYTGGQFLWPLPSPYFTDHISSGYGYRDGTYSGFHAGIDIWCPAGTPIYAVLDGVVVTAYPSDSAGNYTVIYHGNGLYSEYMHQSAFAVSQGDTVTRGQVIGYVGSTGWSTGPHLHIGVVVSQGGFNASCRVDPGPYLGIY